MDKTDIEKLLTAMDNGAKEAFLSMTVENQRLVLFSIEISNSNRIANVEKKQIEIDRDMREYRRTRERREDHNDESIMDTTQKILKAIAEAEAKKFNVGVYVRDKILPTVITFVTLALLALAFGYKP